MWVGLALNVTSGLFLLTAYPTKALTNPDFYIKLSFIGLAVFTMRRMNIQVFEDASLDEVAMIAKGKMMAAWSLAFWIGAVSRAACSRRLPSMCSMATYGDLRSGTR